jgi:hypothetical protein
MLKLEVKGTYWIYLTQERHRYLETGNGISVP